MFSNSKKKNSLCSNYLLNEILSGKNNCIKN